MEKRDFRSVGSDYKIFKDFKSGTFRMIPPVMTVPAHYMEEPMDFDWEITAKTDTILGLACIQALTRYGGRNYQVWFSPEIPISDGPWTFRGLPGLILKVKDEWGWYTFTATRIITRKTNRYLKADWINEFSKKIDRKTFVDHLTAYKRNPPKPIGVLDFPEDRMLAIKKAYQKRFDLLLEQY
jgi:GLPGLI family protein